MPGYGLLNRQGNSWPVYLDSPLSVDGGTNVELFNFILEFKNEIEQGVAGLFLELYGCDMPDLTKSMQK